MRPFKNLWLIVLISLSMVLIGSAQTVFEDVTVNHGFISVSNSDLNGGGVSAEDFDNDGDLDLFVATAPGIADQVYRNDNGIFVSIGDQIGISSTSRSRMALWIDIDGDQDLDLLIGGDCVEEQTCPSAINTRLYLNEGGQFTDVSEAAGLIGYGPNALGQTVGGLAAADINNDGYVDFVQAIYNGRVEVYINQKDGTFVESAQVLGISVKFKQYYQLMIHDFNEDGLMDIYCNVDFTANQFWVQTSYGKFEEHGYRTFSNSAYNEMGMTLGDYDRDGDLDIYSTNIDNFRNGGSHNILLRNDFISKSNFRFTELGQTMGVGSSGWGWGTTFLDGNNDGLLDLAATNGFDLFSEYIDESKYWMQKPDGSYLDESSSVGFNDDLNGNSLISLDFDRDGDLDLIQTIKGFEDPRVVVRLLENKISLENRGNYVVVKPRMTGANYYALGAVVTAYVEDVPLMRLIHAGTSFFGQEPSEAFIGLGQATAIDSISIVWPGGDESWWYNIEVNETLVLTDEELVHSPTGFSALAIPGGIELKWIDYSNNETGFELLKADNIDFVNAQIISIGSNQSSFKDLDVVYNSAYFYKLRALQNFNGSRFTDVLQVKADVLSTESIRSIGVYPNPWNPTNGELTIESNVPIESIVILDMFGRRIEPNISSRSNINGHYFFSIRNLETGLHFILLNDQMKRLIVY